MKENIKKLLISSRPTPAFEPSCHTPVFLIIYLGSMKFCTKVGHVTQNCYKKFKVKGLKVKVTAWRKDG